MVNHRNLHANPVSTVHQVVLLQLKLFAQSVIDVLQFLYLKLGLQSHVKIQINIKMKLGQ